MGPPSAKKIKLDTKSDIKTGIKKLKSETKNKIDSVDEIKQNMKPGTSTSRRKINKSKKFSPLISQVAINANISEDLATTILEFFDNDVTIPFMVRYRSDTIKNTSAQDLRLILDLYKSLKSVQARGDFIKKALQSKGVLNDELEFLIDNAQSLGELEEIYTPFKDKKKNKLQQADDCGVLSKIKALLNGTEMVNLVDIINPKLELVKDKKTARGLVINVLSTLMFQDMELISELPKLYNPSYVIITSRKAKRTSSKGENKKPKSKEDHFAHYYNYHKRYDSVKSHQILAINRGEDQKDLKVEIILPKQLYVNLENFINKKWLQVGLNYLFRNIIIKETYNTELYKKVEKNLIRKLRTEVTRKAEKDGLIIFSSNLKWLLLTPPVRNQTVLSIDPGYTSGCKIAVVSPEQKVLNTNFSNIRDVKAFSNNLDNLVKKYNVSLIAVGNGLGCRDVEKVVGQFIKGTKLKYTIVSEQGVSIYSCSNDAKKEYPNFIPNLISAVSLAKRVIDPLGELIKVEPKHLGIGMYQHDLNPKRLEEMLNEVVTEVVSTVGVNLNTASLHLLKHVAGLNESRAKSIINHRESNGPFTERKQLLELKGIGKKTFEQCAGFVRIFPQENERLPEPLDQTIIHPEDYKAASKFITAICKLRKHDIGTETFITKVKEIKEKLGKEAVCEKIKINEDSFNVLYEALTNTINYDIRTECAEQLFRSEIMTFEDLIVGQQLSGRVENVTTFGSFIDIGVGKAMLLPLNNVNQDSCDLHYGQRVLVRVIDIDKTQQRVSLMLIKVLSK